MKTKRTQHTVTTVAHSGVRRFFKNLNILAYVTKGALTLAAAIIVSARYYLC
jgi:hypothetical protein